MGYGTSSYLFSSGLELTWFSISIIHKNAAYVPPDIPRVATAADEPPFVHNALPFYWISQEALMAYQENHPFRGRFGTEEGFRMGGGQWLKHIRGFLKRADKTPTLL